MAEVIGMIVGAALTLLIFGYLLGDLPGLGSFFQSLYRLALHIFVGALMGYSAAVVIREVWLKTIIAQLGSNPALAIPVLIGLGLFLFKSIRRLPYLKNIVELFGNFFMAPLIGVGIAIALSGVFLGTLVPQVEATAGAMHTESLLSIEDLIDLFRGLLIVLGTICTLMVFSSISTAQRPPGATGLWHQVVGALAGIGRWFLLVTFGVAFAGALTASLTIFISRIQYLIEVLETFL
jgi:hypothetical protein